MLVGSEVVHFDDLATLRGANSGIVAPPVTEYKKRGGRKTSPPSELSGMVRSFLRRNRAVVARLAFRHAVGRELVIVSAHLHWNPAYEYVKLCQAKYLLERAAALAACNFEHGECCPVVVCGDLNSTPGSVVHGLCVAKSVDARRAAPWIRCGDREGEEIENKNGANGRNHRQSTVSENLCATVGRDAAKREAGNGYIAESLSTDLNKYCGLAVMDADAKKMDGEHATRDAPDDGAECRGSDPHEEVRGIDSGGFVRKEKTNTSSNGASRNSRGPVQEGHGDGDMGAFRDENICETSISRGRTRCGAPAGRPRGGDRAPEVNGYVMRGLPAELTVYCGAVGAGDKEDDDRDRRHAGRGASAMEIPGEKGGTTNGRTHDFPKYSETVGAADEIDNRVDRAGPVITENALEPTAPHRDLASRQPSDFLKYCGSVGSADDMQNLTERDGVLPVTSEDAAEANFNYCGPGGSDHEIQNRVVRGSGVARAVEANVGREDMASRPPLGSETGSSNKTNIGIDASNMFEGKNIGMTQGVGPQNKSSDKVHLQSPKDNDDINSNYNELKARLSSRRLNKIATPQDYQHSISPPVRYMLDYTLNRFTR